MLVSIFNREMTILQSCKAIGIHLKKVCASYLVGAVVGCSAYPSASEFFNAPYFCAVQINDFLSSLGVASELANLRKSRRLASDENHIPGDSRNTRQLAGSLPFSVANLTLNHSTLENYLKSNMTQNCQRRCYQRYINQGNDLFAGVCRKQAYNLSNPFAQLLGIHQELRNQICGELIFILDVE